MERQTTLEAVFNAQLLGEPRMKFERKMGFSGASVMECECNWETGKASSLPSTVFIKQIVLEPPEDGASEDAVSKWRRNRQSYLNEIHFLAQYAPALMEKAGNAIPKVFKVLHQGKFEAKGDDAESFLFVSESMSHNTQIIEVTDNKQHLTSTLDWLAGMHAQYHGKHQSAESIGQSEMDSVWREGTHLALAKRPLKELENLPKNWQAFCEAFKWPAFADLGSRVAAITPKIAVHLSPVALQKAMDDGQTCDNNAMRRFTLVHGDAKPANLFFSGEGEEGESVKAWAIDWQWAGWGVGATDIVYFLATGMSDAQINSLNLEADVLRPYYSVFSSHWSKLRAGEGECDYPFEEFIFDFKCACVDYVRWIMACRLPGETPEKFAKRREEMDPNLGAYRRSETMMLFLISKVEEYLPDIEARLGPK